MRNLGQSLNRPNEVTPGYGNSRVTVARFKQISALTCLCTIAFAALIIIGWLAKVDVLRNPFSDQEPIAISVALAFLLSGTSLIYQLSPSWTTATGAVGRALAAIAGGIALFVLGNYAFEWGLDPDRLFSNSVLAPLDGNAQGHMSPITALGFSLTAISLFFLDTEARRGHRPAQYIIGLPLLFGLTALMGHVFQLTPVISIGSFAYMPMPTAMLFVLMSLGVLLARPDRGLMNVITNPGAGGMMARNLLPAAFGLPILLGLLRIAGEQSGLFTADFGVVLIIVLMISALFWIIWGTSYQLGKMDTARRLADEALRDSAERTQSIIDKATDAFIATSLDGKIVDWNPRAERTFGWSKAEVLGKPVDEVILPPHLRDKRGMSFFLRRGEGPVINRRVEMTALNKDGHEFPVEMAVFSVGSELNSAVCIFLHDISERKQHEEEVNCLNKALLEQINDAALKNESLEHLTRELRLACEQAQESTKQKSDFIANVSHEIRTPISMVIGMTELLLDTELDPDQKRIASTVYSSATALLGIINDILEYSKIEARKIELQEANSSRSDLIAQVEDSKKREMTRSGAAAPAKTAPSPAEERSKENKEVILLAEDNPALRELTFRQLKKLGCDVDCVSDGKEALHAVHERDYSLILMDCQMPNMDGFESTRRIRDYESKRQRHTPIVALTASVLPGDRESCFIAGMDDFLAKPISLDDIRGIVKRWVTKPDGALETGGRAAAATQVFKEPSMESEFLKGKSGDSLISLEMEGAAAASTQQLMPNASSQLPIDLAWLAREYGAESIGEILQTFCDEANQLLNQLHDAIERNLPREQASITHQLKGIAAVIGASELRVLSQLLEQAIKENNQQVITSAFLNLTQSMDLLQTWIRSELTRGGEGVENQH
ncbi:MAG TPA: response regulator [Candidatus Obscuribacterales bacterium]